MRMFLSFLAGGLFGTGLYFSGMTDTTKVQGWLDVFGNWDPTLAFVMGGAIIPMFIAWRLTEGRAPLVGGNFPQPSKPELDRRLIVGSTMFGIGWGLVGLCPGPVFASLSYNGWGGIWFLLAMLAGMMVAPKFGMQLDRQMTKA